MLKLNIESWKKMGLDREEIGLVSPIKEQYQGQLIRVEF